MANVGGHLAPPAAAQSKACTAARITGSAVWNLMEAIAALEVLGTHLTALTSQLPNNCRR